jgi:hypothetical protein
MNIVHLFEEHFFVRHGIKRREANKIVLLVQLKVVTKIKHEIKTPPHEPRKCVTTATAPMPFWSREF